MLCLSGFQQYSRWVPLFNQIFSRWTACKLASPGCCCTLLAESLRYFQRRLSKKTSRSYYWPRLRLRNWPLQRGPRWKRHYVRKFQTLTTFNLSTVGEFSSSWIVRDNVQVQKEKGKFVVVHVCSAEVNAPSILNYAKQLPLDLKQHFVKCLFICNMHMFIRTSVLWRSLSHNLFHF